MGTTKNRNGMDLTEAEDIKKRWQEYTGKLYKNDLHDPDNHDDMITHLEPDILEYKVQWALGSINANKASGGDGIPAKLFQILKDDALGEGNGNPLQCSRLENPRDGGAWWAAVYGVTQSWKQLK